MELKEQHAKNFREFLFSKKNLGPGRPPASSSEIERQRSSSIASSQREPFLCGSPRHSIPSATSGSGDKRSFLDSSQSSNAIDNEEMMKRFKADSLNTRENMDAKSSVRMNNAHEMISNVERRNSAHEMISNGEWKNSAHEMVSNGERKNSAYEMTSKAESAKEGAEQSGSDDDIEFVSTTPAIASAKAHGEGKHFSEFSNFDSDASDEVKIVDSKPASVPNEGMTDFDAASARGEEVVFHSSSKDYDDDEDGVDDDDDDGDEDGDEDEDNAGIDDGIQILEGHEHKWNGNESNTPKVSLLLQAAESHPFLRQAAESHPEAQIDAMRILADATEERELVDDREEDRFTDDAAEDAAMMFLTSMKESQKRETANTILAFAAKDLESKSRQKCVDPIDAMLSRLPELPSEPNYDFSTACRQDKSQAEESAPIPLDVKEPVVLKRGEEGLEETLYYSPIDAWFPSNNAIKREKKKKKVDDSTVMKIDAPDGNRLNVSASTRKRVAKNAEPGIIDKLPHCLLYEREQQALYGKLSKEPYFCTQVTEIYCNSPMLCCSKCSTWRHAGCGGHHTFYSPTMAEKNFVPLCDRCFKEKPLMDRYPNAEKRIARQRDVHLRKTNAAGEIIRYAAYAKHGGTYKWPLGSVSASHITGHSRSVQIRNERSEKQWKDMLNNLNHSSIGKSKERVKQRTKELERVLNNLEEAEGKTDRHNMILFLERDTEKRYPAGFENPQLNFFDPEEDHVRLACVNDKTANDSLKNLMIGDADSAYDSESNACQEDEDDIGPKISVGNILEPILGRTKGTNTKKSKVSKHCVRPGCTRKPRFDSTFCSDACGVSVMEADLLRSMTFANNMHPFHLRN